MQIEVFTHRTFLGIFSFILDLETLSKLILVEKRHVYVLLGCIKTCISNYKIIFFCIIPPVCLNTFRSVLQCISPSHIIHLLPCSNRPAFVFMCHRLRFCAKSSVILYTFMSSFMSSSHLFLGLSFFPFPAKLWYHPIPFLTRGHTISVASF